MEYTIQKDNMTLTCGTEGAELHSLTVDGRPMLWDAKAEIWGRHAPVCFPWCGDMDGWFEEAGRKYPDSNLRHGFVRSMEHSLTGSTGDSVSLRLDWAGNDSLWPWPFSFETTHRVEKDRFTTTCTAVNTGDWPMPVQFGFHPAFLCPFVEGSQLSDYQVRLENGTLIPLHDRLFDIDSICFPGCGAWARLEHRPSGRCLQVETGDFDCVLLWSKPGPTGFVCIEPWQGYPGKGHDLMARPWTRLLNPGESRSWTLDVSFHL